MRKNLPSRLEIAYISKSGSICPDLYRLLGATGDSGGVGPSPPLPVSPPEPQESSSSCR